MAMCVLCCSADGFKVDKLSAAESKKFSSRITVDQKRAATQGLQGHGVDGSGGDGKGYADEGGEEEGCCQECGKTALGAIDLSNNFFYCNECWALFQVMVVVS